jgi:hypothetical protein
MLHTHGRVLAQTQGCRGLHAARESGSPQLLSRAHLDAHNVARMGADNGPGAQALCVCVVAELRMLKCIQICTAKLVLTGLRLSPGEHASQVRRKTLCDQTYVYFLSY